MNAVGISESIISITSPGTRLTTNDDNLARQLSRDCKLFAADLKRRRPEKFGFWAALPLPDIERSLAKISFAFDN